MASPDARGVLTRSATHSDAVRITRLSARFIATGYLFYFVLLLPSIISQSMFYPGWWTPVAVGVAFIPSLPLAFASFGSRTELTARAALACGAGYVCAAVGSVLLDPTATIPDTPWLCMFPGLAAMAVALVVRPQYTLAYLAVVTVLAQLLNLHSAPGQNASFVLAVIGGFTFSLLFVTGILMMVRTGHVLDATRPQVEAAAAATATVRARELERDRFAGLLHDWVMASLGSVGGHAATDAIRHQARVALSKLDSADDAYAAHDKTVDALPLIAEIRSAVRDILPTLAIETAVTSDSLRIPVSAVRVLSASAAEAVRNSLKHAGPGITSTVTAHCDDATVRVIISDDGAGFDPAIPRPDRFGLQRMVEQIDRLDGAAVDVRSRPGGGTTIVLTWTMA